MWPIHALINKLLKLDVREEDDDMSWAALFNFSSRNGNSGRSYFIKVPHIRQLRSWDCGLACVLMVLKTLGLNHYDLQDLEELCRTTSIWTVDLAYLLRKLSVRFLFFTVTIGANPDFSVETFYKEQLANDIGRVDMLFQRSIEEGIKIEPWREDVRMPRFYEGTAAYTGHYVVICGYDAHTDEFEIRDPASPRESDRISSKCLEEARKSYGTDEDILLVSLANNNK